MARLVPALNSGKGYHYRVTLSKSPVVNAYALPGGRLIVNHGLLAKIDSHEELLRSVFRRHPEVISVTLFGSRARGTHSGSLGCRTRHQWQPGCAGR